MFHLAATVLVVLASPGRADPGPLALHPYIVMVDPGHGGTNLGARCVTRTFEKHFTLLAARLLRQELRAQPGLRVTLTRHKDVYLTLSERVRRANQARASLFVSLHGNASPKKNQRGFEAFVLSPEGLDLLRTPAAQHPLNKRNLLSPPLARRMRVRAALTELRQRGLRRESLQIGRLIMKELGRRLGSRWSRGLRQAQLDVLLGLEMPGVLVEMGFLDHPVEGRLLVRRAYLKRAVQGIARAVIRYGRLRGMLRAPPANASGRPDRLPIPPRSIRRLNRRLGPPPDQRTAPPDWRRPEMAEHRA